MVSLRRARDHLAPHLLPVIKILVAVAVAVVRRRTFDVRHVVVVRPVQIYDVPLLINAQGPLLVARQELVLELRVLHGLVEHEPRGVDFQHLLLAAPAGGR